MKIVKWGRAESDGCFVRRRSKCGNYTIETVFCSWGGSRGDNTFSVRRGDGTLLEFGKREKTRSTHSLARAQEAAQRDFCEE
jgi:hypothetical protein